ncbi:MAG: hypothetical protein CMG25_01460 [Candidatus Marinimicrobia bacterium]|nr:hypothetical protein [Candidatus Neomarinimicrobiota bacterium]|tara:strand:- start:479 stop:1330 length:852 start_codon:yes stop_codon:yes gene_type:complete
MALAMFSWGIAWSNAKVVNEYFSYSNLVFLRYLSSFLFLFIIFSIRRKTIQWPRFKTFINITIVSFLYYIYNIFFFLGTDVGEAGMGGVFVTTTNPIITFTIISMIDKVIHKKQIIGICIGALGGCIILNLFELGFSSMFIGENLYFLICSITWGIITVVMTYGQKDYDSISYIILCYMITAIISSCFIVPSEIFDYSKYDFRFFINFFFVSIGAMCFGTSVYMYAAPRIGPIETSVFIFTVPFIAMGTAYIILDEPLKLEVIVGGLLGILAVYLVNSKPSRT